MRNVLVAEEVKSGENGVGSSLTETAKGVSLDVVTKVLESVDILERSLAVCDLVKELKKTLCTNTAGSALTAGLLHG